MRPTPIPDHEIPAGYQRLVVAPPGGDLTDPDIAPVEAITEPGAAVPLLSVRCVLEEGEHELLTAGGTIWLTFAGHMVPWAATVVEAVPHG